jgi:hypothetical protein
MLNFVELNVGLVAVAKTKTSKKALEGRIANHVTNAKQDKIQLLETAVSATR